MKVFLLEWRQEKSLHGWASVGIQYIVSALKSEGHTAQAEVFEGINIARTAELILKAGPDIVGFSVFKENLYEMYELAQLIKEKKSEITIIAGGHTATLYAAKILKSTPYIDVISYGEGEMTFVEICKRMEEKHSIKDCNGIFYRVGEKTFKNPKMELIQTLDLLPNPDMDIVRKINYEKNPFVFTSVSTSRGCLGNCGFCVEHRVSKGTPGIKWRGRTPEHILQEIQELSEGFPNKRLIINFVDGSIEDPDPIEKKRLKNMMDLIDKSGIKIAFSFLTRAESWTEKDVNLIQKMKKLGLFCASIGLESGSDESLRMLGKKATLDDNLRAYRLFQENGVGVNGFLILFHPYVTLEDLKKSARFIKECKLAVKMEAWSNAVYIYPDTRMFQKVVSDGLITGTDKTGFMYNYAFEDGRIEKIYQIMKEISNDKGVIHLQNIIDKSTRAIQLYQIWKEQDITFLRIQNEMEEFTDFIDKSMDDIGAYQFNQFIKLIDCFEKNYQYDEIEYISNKWILDMKEFILVIEKYWIRIQMQLARQGFKLV